MTKFNPKSSQRRDGAGAAEAKTLDELVKPVHETNNDNNKIMLTRVGEAAQGSRTTAPTTTISDEPKTGDRDTTADMVVNRRVKPTNTIIIITITITDEGQKRTPRRAIR